MGHRYRELAILRCVCIRYAFRFRLKLAEPAFVSPVRWRAIRLHLAFYVPSLTLLISLGSWGGDVRIWKLDPKLKSFSLAGNLPLPGIVNSLQLVTPPRQFAESVSWPARTGVDPTSDGSDDEMEHQPPSEPNALMVDSAARSRPPLIRSSPVWLIAGVGQEHRLGRWLKVKGNGAVNCSIVAAFHPRTP